MDALEEAGLPPLELRKLLVQSCKQPDKRECRKNDRRVLARLDTQNVRSMKSCGRLTRSKTA